MRLSINKVASLTFLVAVFLSACTSMVSEPFAEKELNTLTSLTDESDPMALMSSKFEGVYFVPGKVHDAKYGYYITVDPISKDAYFAPLNEFGKAKFRPMPKQDGKSKSVEGVLNAGAENRTFKAFAMNDGTYGAPRGQMIFEQGGQIKSQTFWKDNGEILKANNWVRNIGDLDGFIAAGQTNANKGNEKADLGACVVIGTAAGVQKMYIANSKNNKFVYQKSLFDHLPVSHIAFSNLATGMVGIAVRTDTDVPTTARLIKDHGTLLRTGNTSDKSNKKEVGDLTIIKGITYNPAYEKFIAWGYNEAEEYKVYTTSGPQSLDWTEVDGAHLSTSLSTKISPEFIVFNGRTQKGIGIAVTPDNKATNINKDGGQKYRIDDKQILPIQ